MLIIDMVSGLHVLKFINTKRVQFIMSVKLKLFFFFRKNKAKINTLSSKHIKTFILSGSINLLPSFPVF